MPILADIQTIASETNNRTVMLSPLSIAVLFSTLDAANRLHDWQGVNRELTQSEVDEIDAALSRARYELMTSLVGQIIIWVNADEPINALYCDGSTYERVDYPELYSAIDPIYHLDSNSFIVPDFRLRFPYGGSNSSDIGSEGGEAEHTLTVGEIPAHTHTIPLTTTTLAVEPGEVAVTTPVPILSDYTGSTGDSGSHNNLPPYHKVAYYIIAR
jgi:microcystin-dependent protein